MNLRCRELQPKESAPPGSKLALVAEARAFLAKTFPEADGQPGACLYHALSIIVVAGRHNLRLVPQAGTCFWPSEDHLWGYEWEPDGLFSRLALANGRMPEMHVWAGDLERQEIVDTSTGLWPSQFERLTGQLWRGPKPPPFLWSPCDDPLTRGRYEPSEAATRLAIDLYSSIIEKRER